MIESYTLEGPSIYFPQPGVAATIQSDTDIRGALADTIKTWAQAVGVIIGYLRINAQPAPSGSGLHLLVQFTCNHPLIGAALLEHSIADLQAAALADPDWNHDDQLFDLRRRRMREDPALPLLQIRAEAQGRALPLLPCSDGAVQIGTGSASWRFDPAQLSVGMAVNPPWEKIRVVPLIAITGDHAVELAQHIAHDLSASGLLLLEHASWQALHEAFCDQTAECIVAVPFIPEVLERGLPFNRCSVAVIDSLAAAPSYLLAAGLPALVADETGAVIAKTNDSRGLDLAERTAAQPILLAAGQALPPIVDPFIQVVAQSVHSFWS